MLVEDLGKPYPIQSDFFTNPTIRAVYNSLFEEVSSNLEPTKKGAIHRLQKDYGYNELETESPLSILVRELETGVYYVKDRTEPFSVLKNAHRVRTVIYIIEKAYIGVNSQNVDLHQQIADNLAMELAEVGSHYDNKYVHTLAEAMQLFDDKRSKILESEEEALGCPYGLESFDELTRGNRYGETTGWLGSPGTGKTNFYARVADWQSQQGFDICLFLLEPQAEEIPQRMISSRMGIGNSELVDPRFAEEHASDYEKHKNLLVYDKPGKVTIIDKNGLSIDQIVFHIRKLRMEGCRLFWIDYLRLIGKDRYAPEEKAEYLTAVKNLKILNALAVEDKNNPIAINIILDVKTDSLEPDGKPSEKSVRGGSGVLHELYTCFALWRAVQYTNKPELLNYGEILCLKFRNGTKADTPVATVNAHFYDLNKYYYNEFGRDVLTWDDDRRHWVVDPALTPTEDDDVVFYEDNDDSLY